MTVEKNLVFSKRVKWGDVEATLKKDEELKSEWELYSRLPRSIRERIFSSCVRELRGGLEGGLLHDFDYVLNIAISEVNLFGALINTEVFFSKGEAESATGKVVEIDLINRKIKVIEENREHRLTFDEVCFCPISLLKDNNVLNFFEAWDFYIDRNIIISLVTGKQYHIDDFGTTFTKDEIMGEWILMSSPIEKEEFLELMLSSDDHIISLFCEISIEYIALHEKCGTIGDIISASYDKKTDVEIEHFLREWIN